MNPLIQLKSAILPLLITFTLAPVVQASPRPKAEDRGNFNSAAENVSALNLATTGLNNTAHGCFSLFSNTTGDNNTANGVQALFNNTTGFFNTGNGAGALYSNTTGSENTANGLSALNSNITGADNTADGSDALLFNMQGSDNTAVGFAALINSTGNANTALGANAGAGVTTANNVICIGANVLGADVSNMTWIGNVYGVTTQSGTTAPVIVSDTGQLGTVASSERFKKDIATMGTASEAILSLRPVAFHYKTDTKGTPQFGLIAEDVAKVNPALVLPDKEGKPYTVRYEAVNAMLLNEFLKEHREVRDLRATVVEQRKQIAALTSQMQQVSEQLRASKASPQLVADNQ